MGDSLDLPSSSLVKLHAPKAEGFDTSGLTLGFWATMDLGSLLAAVVCMAFDPRCQPVLVLGWQLLLRQLQQKCPRRPALSVTSCGVTGCT